MAGAFLYDDKVAAATLSAPGSTTVSTLPLSNLVDPQPRLRARLMGSAAAVLVDFGADISIEAAALISTTLNASATARWRIGAGEGLIEAVSTFDIRFTDLVPVYPAGWTFNRATIGYFFDATGTLTQAAAHAPRLDYDPVSRLLRGLLLEEARTNFLRNPRLEGGGTGSPGTVPTNCSGPTGAGVTRTINAFSTENGLPYMETRFQGSGTTGNSSIIFETATHVAATIGQVFTFSFYARLVNGSAANVTAFQLMVDECDSGGATLVSGTSNFTPALLPLGQARFAYTYTVTNASTAFLRPRFRETHGTAAFDFTLRLATPQCEIGAVVSSPILPTVGVPADTTRQADQARVTGLTIGQAFTLLIQGQVSGNAGQALVPGGVTDAVGFNDSTYFAIDPSGNGTATTLAAGVNYASVSSVAASVGAQTTMVVAADSSGISFARAGTLRANVTTFPVPAALDTASVGGAPWPTAGIAVGIGWYQRLKLYPTRLLDTQVTALSSTGSSLVAGALTYDSGVVTAATGDDANGNVIMLRPAAVTGRYLQVDIAAPSASYIDLGRLVAGTLWRPSRATAYGVQEGRVILDRRDRNAFTGAEFPVAALANPRTARFTLPLLKSAEIIGAHRAMQRQLGAAGDALWVPDTALSQAEINNRSIWGAISSPGDTAVAVRDTPYGFSRAFVLTERL